MNTDLLPVVAVKGTALERGLQQGEELRPLIRTNVDSWLDRLGEARGCKPIAYLEHFLNSTGYVGACERHAPHLLDELTGLADGAGLTPLEAMAFQLQDEEWVHARNARLGLRPGEAERCSSLGFLGENREAAIGQNMDIGRSSDGYQILVHHRYDDGTPDALVLTVAGGLALFGLNRAGLGICCNSLMQLDFNTGGLPVTFVVRRFLEHGGFSKGRAFLTHVPHASGQNYLIGAPDGIASLECSASKVVDYVSAGAPKRRLHTNHALLNDDQDFVRSHFPDQSLPNLSGSPTSERRMAALERRFSDASRPAGLPDLFSALASRDDPAGPVCRDGKSGMPGDPDAHIGFTAISAVFELRDEPIAHVAAGPPSECEFRAVDFARLDALVAPGRVTFGELRALPFLLA